MKVKEIMVKRRYVSISIMDRRKGKSNLTKPYLATKKKIFQVKD